MSSLLRSRSCCRTRPSLRDGETERVPLDGLRRSDVVLVRPGARVPADGAIVAGEAELDESMITGESKPVPKGEGTRSPPAPSPPTPPSAFA